MFYDPVFADRFRYQMTMFGFRVLIGLSPLIHTHIVYEIDTTKIIAAFFRIFNCLLEFNRLPCSNSKMYDDAFFASRFRYQLSMFGIRLLIGLSRLIHAHVAYETDGAKIIAAFCRISYCLHDLIRLN